MFLRFALLTETKKLASLVLVIGEKNINIMNNKITYTDEPMELGERIEDFLPPPEKLIPKINKVKVTFCYILVSMVLNFSSVRA